MIYLMSSKRFETILSNIDYTTEKLPSYKDCFWEVREMICSFVYSKISLILSLSLMDAKIVLLI